MLPTIRVSPFAYPHPIWLMTHFPFAGLQCGYQEPAHHVRHVAQPRSADPAGVRRYHVRRVHCTGRAICIDCRGGVVLKEWQVERKAKQRGRIDCNGETAAGRGADASRERDVCRQVEGPAHFDIEGQLGVVRG